MSVPHMTPEEFRHHGHAAVDWVADYLARVQTLPVLSQVTPGAVRSRLPDRPPEEPEPFDALLADLDSVVLPGITHWQSPNFFGFFPANASPPAILGELISAGLGVQGMLWATSPACTELETHVLDWMVDLLGLPQGFRGGGVIQDTASAATLCALVAARERATAGTANRTGVTRRLTVYASSQAHSSVEKAARIAGLGSEQVRPVDVDDAFAMRADDLARLVDQDRRGGAVPCMVVATVGTTSSTAIDPVRALAAVAGREGVWLHVDAAYAGSAAVCPELRWMHDGLDHADSYVFNPHKWLLTNFDCSCFYVREPSELVGALTILPEYLRNPATEGGAVIDYRDWQVELGRRFRALKLWFVLRSYARSGLQAHIRGHVALAQEFAAWVRADPAFELAAPVPLGLVCFRHVGGDGVNEAILADVNASGLRYLTHTRLQGRHTLRLAIGAPGTGREHVAAAWEALREAGARHSSPR